MSATSSFVSGDLFFQLVDQTRAIAFYLRHRSEVDRHLAEHDSRWLDFQRQTAARMGPLIERMRTRAEASP